MSVSEDSVQMPGNAGEHVQAIEVFGVLTTSFRVLMQNFVPFIAISLLFMVPVILLEMGAGLLSPAMQASTGFAGFIINQIVVGALVYGTFKSLHGEKAGIGDALSNGLRRFVPMVLVAIVMMVICGIGFVFLIIPGIILAIMFAVAVPATVVENTGVFESLSRSRELTKGNRWRVFAVLLLFWLMTVVFSLVFAGTMFVGFSADASIAALSVISYGLNALLTAFYAVAIGVTYHSLRVARDGVDASQLAAVFD